MKGKRATVRHREKQIWVGLGRWAGGGKEIDLVVKTERGTES